MGLMASLFIGVTGLQTSQNSLNTTAHNLSNVNTTGYTRQQILHQDKTYERLSINVNAISNKQTGLGVEYARTRQVRDHFLDQTYRREVGREKFYGVCYDVSREVETRLGELYGATFADSLAGLKESMEELAKTPCDAVVQGLVVQRASSFVSAAQDVYQGLSDYQDNLNLQLKNQVEKLNKFGNEIRTLNNQILRVEAAGVEKANDLRDARNQILDQMSEMVNMQYSEDIYGNVRVLIEGHDFVLKDTVFEIGLKQDKLTGFYTPFWVMNADYTVDANGEKDYDIEGAEVFNVNRNISPEWNTDVGGLKSLYLARGDHRGSYLDLDPEAYADGNIEKSILMNSQAEFDGLVHNLIDKINSLLFDTARQPDDPDTEFPYNCKEVEVDGEITYQPILLFNMKNTDDMVYNNGTKKWEMSIPDDPKDWTPYNTYSVTNIIVNPDLVKTPTLIGLRKPDGEEDRQTADAMAKAFQDDLHTLNPTTNMKFNYIDLYAGIVNQVGNDGNIYREYMESQQNTVEATYSNREQLLGVSSDDELSHMIRFQNAYNANSRYINVVNEMLAHLLNALAGA